MFGSFWLSNFLGPKHDPQKIPPRVAKQKSWTCSIFNNWRPHQNPARIAEILGEEKQKICAWLPSMWAFKLTSFFWASSRFSVHRARRAGRFVPLHGCFRLNASNLCMRNSSSQNFSFSIGKKPGWGGNIQERLWAVLVAFCASHFCFVHVPEKGNISCSAVWHPLTHFSSCAVSTGCEEWSVLAHRVRRRWSTSFVTAPKTGLFLVFRSDVERPPNCAKIKIFWKK